MFAGHYLRTYVNIDVPDNDEFVNHRITIQDCNSEYSDPPMGPYRLKKETCPETGSSCYGSKCHEEFCSRRG